MCPPHAAAALRLHGADWLRSSETGASLDEAAEGIVARMGAAAGSGSSSDEPGSSGAGGWRAPAEAWEAELAAELAAGEGPVMEALGAYLRSVETELAGSSSSTSSSSSGSGGGDGELAARLRAAVARYDIPAAPEGCFPALFSRWLQGSGSALLLCAR